MSKSKDDSELSLSGIKSHSDPEKAEFYEATIEDRVRYAWRYYKEHEIEAARLRRSEGRSQGNIPKSERCYTGGSPSRSVKTIAAKVGLKRTNYVYASKVVLFADRLEVRGERELAKHLLYLLNNVSVNAARIECDRIQDSLTRYKREPNKLKKEDETKDDPGSSE